jgi:hypothetical protein
MPSVPPRAERGAVLIGSDLLLLGRTTGPRPSAPGPRSPDALSGAGQINMGWGCDSPFGVAVSTPNDKRAADLSVGGPLPSLAPPHTRGEAPAPRELRGYGTSTASMMWITPLAVKISVAVMLASFTWAPPLRVMVTVVPCTVVTSSPSARSEANTRPSMTW